MYAQSCSQYASWSLLITLFALLRMYKFFSAIVNSFHQDDNSYQEAVVMQEKYWGKRADEVNMPSTFTEHAKINRMVGFLETLRTQL